MQIQGLETNYQILNLERVLNLPKEVFSAQNDLAKKLLLLANQEKIQSDSLTNKSRIVDMFV